MRPPFGSLLKIIEVFGFGSFAPSLPIYQLHFEFFKYCRRYLILEFAMTWRRLERLPESKSTAFCFDFAVLPLKDERFVHRFVGEIADARIGKYGMTIEACPITLMYMAEAVQGRAYHLDSVPEIGTTDVVPS